MLDIVQAKMSDAPEVLDFYNVVTIAMAKTKYHSGWQVGVYPTEEYLNEAIQNKELYIARDGGEIVAGVMINHSCHEGYAEIEWENDFTNAEVLMVHTLAVRPSYQGKGAAKEICKFVLDYARTNNMKAVRLEVFGINKAAQNLYTGMGFTFKGSVQMYYDDTGLDEYLVYEYII